MWLKPEEWYEKNGCYSGSGITEGDSYYLFYTGNVRDSEGRQGNLSVSGNVLRME